jgi:hypothetical protein
MTKRPISVLILCIIGLGLGTLGICSAPFGVVPYAIDLGVPNPVVDMVKGNDLVFGYMMASLGVGLILNLFMVTCCIGALMLKPWARWGLIGYAAIAVLLGCVGLVFNYTWMIPQMRDMGDAAVMGGAVGGIVGGCIGLLLPTAIVIVMFLPDVREAFAGPSDLA